MQSHPQRPWILSCLAWIAAGWFLVGLVGLLASFVLHGGDGVYVFFGCHLAAFVIGLSSYERLGGICAGLAAILLILYVAWASAMGAAG